MVRPSRHAPPLHITRATAQPDSLTETQVTQGSPMNSSNIFRKFGVPVDIVSTCVLSARQRCWAGSWQPWQDRLRKNGRWTCTKALNKPDAYSKPLAALCPLRRLHHGSSFYPTSEGQIKQRRNANDSPRPVSGSHPSTAWNPSVPQPGLLPFLMSFSTPGLA